jgi:ketosteroid isomerase-like protein
MSQADVEVLRRGFEAFSQEGISGVLPLGSDDFELVTPGIVGGGREGLTRALQDQLDVFEEWTVEPEEFIDLGDQVLVVVRQRARGRGSGVTIDTHSAWVFTMRDGKAVRLAIHVGKQEALAALSEDQTRRQ